MGIVINIYITLRHRGDEEKESEKERKRDRRRQREREREREIGKKEKGDNVDSSIRQLIVEEIKNNPTIFLPHLQQPSFPLSYFGHI